MYVIYLLKDFLVTEISCSTRIAACSKSTSSAKVCWQATLTYNPNHVSSFQFIIHAILATRMHLHLWHADRNRVCGSLDSISLSQLAPAPHIESA
jgi:hypothetical protein